MAIFWQQLEKLGYFLLQHLVTVVAMLNHENLQPFLLPKLPFLTKKQENRKRVLDWSEVYSLQTILGQNCS